MKNLILRIFVIAMVLRGTNAFAQFKNPVKAATNLAHLERAITHTPLSASSASRFPVWVPARILKNGYVYLQPLAVPQDITPVTASLVTKAGNQADLSRMKTLAEQFVFKSAKDPGYDKAFYEDQSQLARDLDAFYKGNAQVYLGPNGREVKLYALPVDGILYKPKEYNTPVVLNAAEYFVIYDVAAQTGQIAQHIPSVYGTFQPLVYDEIWQAMGSDKVFDDLGNLCDSIVMAHLHKARLDQLGVAGANVASVVKANRAAVFKQLNNIDELLPYLQQLPVVRQQTNGFKAYVVPLPVVGLTLVEADGTHKLYNPQEHVMLFFELGAAGIFPRAAIENPELFTPVE